MKVKNARLFTMVAQVSGAAIGLTLLRPISAAPPDAAASARYEAVQVTAVRVADGIDVPREYLVALEGNLLEELRKTGRFSTVSPSGAKLADTAVSAIEVGITIRNFKPGKRLVRWALGPVAGNTKLVADLQVFDKATRKLILEREIDGRVAIGMFGGDSIGAARGAAKEAAKTIEKAIPKDLLSDEPGEKSRARRQEVRQ